MAIEYVGVAQLDRASGYGPEGREFESSRPRWRDLIYQISFCIIRNNKFYNYCIYSLQKLKQYVIFFTFVLVYVKIVKYVTEV